MTESCRLITTEQYQEYLKLKEEHKPLSWEELKEEAKKMGYVVESFPGEHYESLRKYGFIFERNGWFLVEKEGEMVEVACGLYYDQMLAIMKALQ